MEPVLVILMMVATCAVVVLLGFLGHKAERDRTAALAGVAGAQGWEFTAARDREFPRRFARFEVFTRGHSRSAFNTMHGAIELWGERVVFQMGDYRYSITRSTGKSSTTQTYKISYIVAMMPFPTPDVTIRPEGVLDSIAGALGFDDIDFEDAEFSRLFHVRGPDRRFAYDLCHPRMIEYLKEHYRGGPPILMRGGAICFHSDRRWEPGSFVPWVGAVREFLALWPSHLVRELASRAGGGDAVR